MGAKVDKNKNIVINNQNEEVIEYLGYEEFPNEKSNNVKIEENVVNKDNNTDQNEKLRATQKSPNENGNEELNKNEDTKKEENINDNKEENKINENIDNKDKNDENKDNIEQEKLNENNINNNIEIKEKENKEEEENNNINNIKEGHNDDIEVKDEPKVEENENNINDKNLEENNQNNNVNNNINENKDDNSNDINIEQNKINQVQDNNDNQEKLNENTNNINNNNNIDDIKKEEGAENNNNINNNINNNNNETHPKKISLPNINVIISEKVLEEGAGNELLFMSNLSKIVNISIKERVKYSEKFCITTKDNFLIYETKENYIKVKKPLAIIPISSIQNIVLFKLTKKVNSYDYFYIEVLLNDNIKKNIYNQIDTFYINDLDNNNNENQSDTALIMFKAEEKNLAKKWYVLLKYLAELKSKK